jgi:HSP20 family protein
MVEKGQGPGWWPDFFEPLRQATERAAEWFSPRSDAAKEGETYTINLELPGVKREDIDISVHDGMLSVTGEKKAERKEEREGYFFSERQYGRFQRSFRLPPDVDEESIKAEFTDGVLSISVPKKALEAPKAKKIEIRS